MPHRAWIYGSWRTRLSLRLQLTLWIVVIFTLIQWVSAGALWIYQNAFVYHAFQNQFTEQSALLAADIREELPGISRERLDRSQTQKLLQAQFDSYFVDVFDAAGARIVDPSRAVPDTNSLPIREALERGGPMPVEHTRWVMTPNDIDPARLRVVLVPTAGSDGLPYVVMQTTTDRYPHEQALLVGRVLLTYALLAPLLGAISGWFISGIAVAPLERIRKAMEDFGPKSLERSLEMPEATPELAELAEQLDESRAKIRQAFAAQERFISNVSHEIKTPIAVMQIEAETLNTKDSPQEVREFVLSVREEMSRLGKLVESFLTLTRLEDGHGEAQATRCGLNDLVMDSIDHCDPMAVQHGVELIPELLGDEEHVDAAVQGDPELLATMLDNLARNAIRYSPAGGTVRIVLEILGDKARIRVVDEGPGIPPERLEEIFDRFARVEDKRRQGRGHGLGLAIAKGIAELHRGSVWAGNNAEGGCTFTIELPAL